MAESVLNQLLAGVGILAVGGLFSLVLMVVSKLASLETRVGTCERDINGVGQKLRDQQQSEERKVA